MTARPIAWRRGPAALSLAGTARLPLGARLIAAEGVEMRRFLLATGNQITGTELAVVGPDHLRWFAVISREPARAAHREEWFEDSVEADGRQVRIRTVAVPAGGVLLLFEVVSEQRDAALAQREFDLLLNGLETSTAPPPALWLLALPPAAGLLWILRRRQRRL